MHLTQKKKAFPLRFIPAFALLIPFQNASASTDSAMRLNGFFSSAVMYSSSSDIYLDGITSKPDPFRTTVLGLNLASNLTPEWSVAGQILTVGSRAGGETELEWAFATWQPDPMFRLRAGKQNLAAWLVSESVEVGKTYPWLRPPEEVYSINPLRTVSGLNIELAIPIGAFEMVNGVTYGSAHAKVWSDSQTQVKAKNLFVYELRFGNESFTTRYSLVSGQSSIDGPLYSIDEIYVLEQAIGLKWEVGDWLVLGEGATGKNSVPSSVVKKAKSEAATASGRVANSPNDPDARLAAQKATTSLMFATKPIMDSTSYYLTLGYNIGSILPHITWASIRSSTDSMSFGDQDRIGGGLRYDIALNLDAKFEYYYVRPVNGTCGMFQRQNLDDFLRTDFAPSHMLGVGVDATF